MSSKKQLSQGIINYLEQNIAFNKFGIVNLNVLASYVTTELTYKELKELIDAKYAHEMSDDEIEYI